MTNRRRFERRLGLFFMFLWILVSIFYMTWDGWLFEWRECGYRGPNQQFNLRISDMEYVRNPDGSITYVRTNNLHNLLYICNLVFLLGWVGLFFNLNWAKQGTMAIMGISLGASLAPLYASDHLYILQIVYNLVHFSGVFMGLYLFKNYRFSLLRGLPAIFATWGLYVSSRVILEPWPFWTEPANAYYSLNQINDMPFYFFGLEYGVFVLILLGVNLWIHFMIRRSNNKAWRVIAPVIAYSSLAIMVLALNLTQPPDMSMGTCP